MPVKILGSQCRQLLLRGSRISPGERGIGAQLASLGDVVALRDAGGIDPLLTGGAEPGERAPKLRGQVEAEVEILGFADLGEVDPGAESVLDQLETIARASDGQAGR